jgi:hypothetical protein
MLERLRFISRRAFRFTPRVRVGRDGFFLPGEASVSALRGTLNFSRLRRGGVPLNRAEPFQMKYMMILVFHEFYFELNVYLMATQL